MRADRRPETVCLVIGHSGDEALAERCGFDDYAGEGNWSGWRVMNYDQEAHAKFDITRQYKKL